MTITNILLALALMALCVIAFELRALIKRMETLRDILRGELDMRPSPRETPGAGQTINVNLSPLQASVPGMQPLVVPVAVTGAQRAEGAQGAALADEPSADGESDEAKRARERERALAEERERALASERADAQAKKAALVTATQSGLIAVKCAACGAENSAYRNVCFNCGGSL